MRFKKFIKIIEKRLCFIGMLCILSTAFMISADVIGRYVFASPIPGVPESSAVLLTIGVFLSLGYAQHEKGNPRVEVILQLFNRKIKMMLSLLVVMLMLFILLILNWSTGKAAIASIAIQEVKFGAIAVPLWPAKLFFPIGIFMLCIRIALDAIDDLINWKKCELNGKHFSDEEAEEG